MSDLTCILRRKGSILLNRADETVICGQAIVEGYLRNGFVFDWVATDEARAKDPIEVHTPSQGLDAATVERVRAATAKMRARAGANPIIAEGLSVTLSVADAEAILAALPTDPHQHGGKGA